jgi:hypothetical protein
MHEISNIIQGRHTCSPWRQDHKGIEHTYHQLEEPKVVCLCSSSVKPGLICLWLLDPEPVETEQDQPGNRGCSQLYRHFMATNQTIYGSDVTRTNPWEIINLPPQ